MVKRALGVLLAAAVWAGPASAAGPAESLLRAIDRTNRAASAQIALAEHVQVGSKTVSTLQIKGLELARGHRGSFHYHVTPAQAGLADASVLVRGSSVWVHYAAFDALSATNRDVKPWLLVDTQSSLGFNPTGLASLGGKEIRALKGLAIVGHGTEGGMRVTNYRGTLSLAQLADSPMMKSLLGSAPSEMSSLLKGSERLEIAVGTDGLVHRMTGVITAPLSDGRRLSVTVDAAFSHYNGSHRPIAFPKRGDVMTVAEFQRATGTAATAADTALLARVVLAAREVGRGYQRSVIPGGKVVQGEITLDFCDKSYASESLRTARLQVAFDAKGGKPGLSNEVVTYSEGGARQAMAELRKAVASCRNGAVASPAKGVTHLTRQVHTVKGHGLLPGAIAVVETDRAVVKGKRVTERIAAVYQVRGNVLSGVYAVGDSLPAVQHAALRAAAKSASRLRANVETGFVR